MRGYLHLSCLLALLLSSVALNAGDVDRGVVISIGSATMEEDGTIVLHLRAESPGRAVGDALLRYPPGHPQYDEMLKHLGGLEKGQEKPVPPWPEK
jgi:hypothetical protein